MTCARCGGTGREIATSKYSKHHGMEINCPMCTPPHAGVNERPPSPPPPEVIPDIEIKPKVRMASLKLAPFKGRSKLEEEFRLSLYVDLQRGNIVWFDYEAMRLRIGKDAYYKPDFVTLSWGGSMTFYEVKGHWREAARVRIRAAAERYRMFSFFAVSKPKGEGWKYEAFS